MYNFVPDHLRADVQELLMKVTNDPRQVELLIGSIASKVWFHQPSHRRPETNYEISVKIGPPLTAWLSITWKRKKAPDHTVTFCAVREKEQWVWQKQEINAELSIAEQRAALGLVEGTTYLRQLKDGSLERYKPHQVA